MKQYKRTDRIATDIQRELAKLICFEIEDVSKNLITITGVKVTNDLAYADISISVLGSAPLPHGGGVDPAIQEALATLNENAKRLRHHLASKVKLRIMPQLRFHYDATLAKANELMKLIAEVVPKGGYEA